VVDYGMGNVGSILNMLKHLGHAACISAQPDDIRHASKLILPGVGAFDAGMSNLAARGLRQALDEAVDGLPPKQQTAALAFLEVYEVIREENSYRALSERIREMTGEDCTTVQASDNWRVARKTIATKLRRQNFHLLIEE